MFGNLEPGFQKATVKTLPLLSSSTIYKFIARVARLENQLSLSINPPNEDDLLVDYVQIRRVLEICELRAIVFSATSVCDKYINDAYAQVAIKINTESNDIIEFSCHRCPASEICMHLLKFTFWINRKSSDNDVPAMFDFWGHELRNAIESHSFRPICINSMFQCEDLTFKDASVGITPAEGLVFLEFALNKMHSFNFMSSNFYRHCRPVYDEFESLYIHHTLLETRNNGITDFNSFFNYMKQQAKTGIYGRFTEASKDFYKSSVWLEMQYLRIRCSLIHQIESRKGAHDDAVILEGLFGKEREYTAADKKREKVKKRFVLTKTEKLENASYRECGLLLDERYPFVCASPDGIAEDHIVEIKAPKSEKDFDKYLVSRQNISPKYMAQIQIQMYLANVDKALYCVLSPNFDENGALHYVWVQYETHYVTDLLNAAEIFWRDTVFPRLIKLYSIQS